MSSDRRPGRLPLAAASLALLAGGLITAEASAARERVQIAVACDAGELARMGRLIRADGQDAFVSKRGDLVRLSSCPALKDRLITAAS